MDATRHRLVRESLEYLTDQARVRTALELESSGNWYLAGELYRAIAQSLPAPTNPETTARLLTRAAASFEIAGQNRPAARAYFDAASALQNSNVRVELAGELFNRAALLFKSIGENFNAGDSWRRAGAAFSDAPIETITTPDNIPPVPYSGGKYTVAGGCYMAAGDAFTQAGDNEKWACMAYWESGRAHSKQFRGYHPFLAYKKALIAGIRFYGTHRRDELRSYLPLTDQEREGRLDPVKVMGEEARLGHYDHYDNRRVFRPEWPQIQTHRDIAAAYLEFYLAFVAVGNLAEGAVYRAAAKERMRRIALLQGDWKTAVLYLLWSLSAGYGESLRRWTATCGLVLLAFSGVYAIGHLIEPVKHWFDYVYFSVVTFTSLGYGDLHPVGVLGKLVACCEIGIGLIMFGLLLSFIGNRFQRL